MNETPRDLLEALKSCDADSINRYKVMLNIKFKESTGIDVIDAGEWTRREMYQHVADNIDGIKRLSDIRSFDYNFWRPGIYVGDIEYIHPIYLQEFKLAKEFATKPLKVCLTSFNTMAEWTFRGQGNFDDIMFEMIDNIFIPEVNSLIRAGAEWIQMDEPALTTNPQHIDSFINGWNYFAKKIKQDAVLSIHNCFSDYKLLWPILPELKKLESICLEFANRDSWKPGLSDSERNAYAEYKKDIKNLFDTGFKASIGLGILPVHTDHETSPELIRDRLLYINNIVENPELVIGCPDCGLRQRSLPVAHKLLKNLVKGAELAR